MHTQAHMQECIDACSECRDECQTMLYNHCLDKGDRHLKPKHVRLMADCIEICQTAANAMMRGSENAAAICNACAVICDACAESCETLTDEAMQRCAEVCRSCAEVCREMSGGVPGMGGSKETSKEQSRI